MCVLGFGHWKVALEPMRSIVTSMTQNAMVPWTPRAPCAIMQPRSPSTFSGQQEASMQRKAEEANEAETQTLRDKGDWIPIGSSFVITQSMIEELLALMEEHLLYRDMIRELKGLLRAGAVVEPGTHTLELSVRKRQPLTAEHIIAELGLSAETVARLKKSAP